MKKTLVVKLLLSLIVLSLCMTAAELYFRYSDHQPLSGRLKYLNNQSDPLLGEKVKWISIQLAKERGLKVDTLLFSSLPAAPLKTSGRFKNEIDDIRKHAKWINIEEAELRVWNHNFIRKLYCDNTLGLEPLDVSEGLKVIYTFEPFDDSPYPVYRYFPGSSSEMEYNKLRFNNFGWGGDTVIEIRKPDNTIRIAFLGASTTQQTSYCDFSYADFIGHWLNAWSARNRLGIRFEIINTGRTGQKSPTFAAIMKYELMPVEPDIVIYYEGRNQFILNDILCTCVDHIPAYSLLQRSALFRRTIAATGIDIFKVIEKSKHEGVLRLPVHMSFVNPDISSSALPLDLPAILRDLDTIRAVNDRLNSSLVVCSYAMLASDRVLSEGLKYAGVYSWWMEQFGAVRLQELALLSIFQNRVFKKYCERHGLKFIDVAKELPRLPEAFNDGVHLNCEGMKYHAWIVLLDLLPFIEEQIRNGNLPRQPQFHFTRHPYLNENFRRVELPFSCN